MAKRAMNDNSLLTVVYGEGMKRNYVMRRYVTTIDPGESVTGEVDFGRAGLWVGYADLDKSSGKYVFTKVRQLTKAVTNGDKRA